MKKLFASAAAAAFIPSFAFAGILVPEVPSNAVPLAVVGIAVAVFAIRAYVKAKKA